MPSPHPVVDGRRTLLAVTRLGQNVVGFGRDSHAPHACHQEVPAALVPHSCCNNISGIHYLSIAQQPECPMYANEDARGAGLKQPSFEEEVAGHER